MEWTAVNADYVRTLRALLPTGAIWTRDPARRLSRLLQGMADELVRAHNAASGLVAECNPGTSTVDGLLADWERVFGSREGYFLAVYPAPSLADRRKAVLFKLTNRGGSSLAYFKAMAIELGATDADALDDPRPFTWQMKLPTDIVRFRAGSGRAGDQLLTTTALARRVMFYVERYKPAHTIVHWTD